MRSVFLLAVVLALATAQSCSNFTRIYTFDDFDINTFISFDQKIPTTLNFRKGWYGMSSQLRLTTFGSSDTAAMGFVFELIGGDVVADANAAMTLRVVPPTEDPGLTGDASTLSSFLGLSLNTAATMAIMSGAFLQSAVAESVNRQTCQSTAIVDLIMAPYFYDEMMNAINMGLVKINTDSYVFLNDTGDLDVSVCLDTNVQATFFQSCDSILTKFGLGLSSTEDLSLALAFGNTSKAQHTCAFNLLKNAIRDKGDDRALQTFTCNWYGTTGTGYCNGVTFTTFNFATYVSLYNTQKDPNVKAGYDKALKTLQTSLEKFDSAWSDFVTRWLGRDVCVDYNIDMDKCNLAGNGCPPDTFTCCSAPGKCVATEDIDSGICDGKDFGYWEEAPDDGKTEYKRDVEESDLEDSDLEERANGLCGPYVGKKLYRIHGNGGQTFSVVKILKPHLSDPSAFSASPNQKDNTMTARTACAFSKLRAAALKSGLSIKINSGFRTITRQNYFWHCYQCKCCNGGNLAARPGTSNHGWGIALDLNTASPGIYNWMARNGRRYGFVRTVPSETWHWEYRP